MLEWYAVIVRLRKLKRKPSQNSALPFKIFRNWSLLLLNPFFKLKCMYVSSRDSTNLDYPFKFRIAWHQRWRSICWRFTKQDFNSSRKLFLPFMIVLKFCWDAFQFSRVMFASFHRTYSVSFVPREVLPTRRIFSCLPFLYFLEFIDTVEPPSWLKILCTSNLWRKKLTSSNTDTVLSRLNWGGLCLEIVEWTNNVRLDLLMFASFSNLLVNIFSWVRSIILLFMFIRQRLQSYAIKMTPCNPWAFMYTQRIINMF